MAPDGVQIINTYGSTTGTAIVVVSYGTTSAFANHPAFNEIERRVSRAGAAVDEFIRAARAERGKQGFRIEAQTVAEEERPKPRPVRQNRPVTHDFVGAGPMRRKWR